MSCCATVSAACVHVCVCVCASRSCNRLIRDLPRHGNMAWMRCWVSEARRSLIHFARTAASKLKSNCTPHTHSAHTLHTHSGHASSCGNQNDDVKIFVHWACRFHFEPNGSISLHLFLYLHELRLLRGFHLQQVSRAWLSVWLPAWPSRISMALIVMGH